VFALMDCNSRLSGMLLSELAVGEHFVNPWPLV
jgi:hypothetical protein